MLQIPTATTRSLPTSGRAVGVGRVPKSMASSMAKAKAPVSVMASMAPQSSSYVLPAQMPPSESLSAVKSSSKSPSSSAQLPAIATRSRPPQMVVCMPPRSAPQFPAAAMPTMTQKISAEVRIQAPAQMPIALKTETGTMPAMIQTISQVYAATASQSQLEKVPRDECQKSEDSKKSKSAETTQSAIATTACVGSQFPIAKGEAEAARILAQANPSRMAPLPVSVVRGGGLPQTQGASAVATMAHVASAAHGSAAQMPVMLTTDRNGVVTATQAPQLLYSGDGGTMFLAYSQPSARGSLAVSGAAAATGTPVLMQMPMRTHSTNNGATAVYLAPASQNATCSGHGGMQAMAGARVATHRVVGCTTMPLRRPLDSQMTRSAPMAKSVATATIKSEASTRTMAMTSTTAGSTPYMSAVPIQRAAIAGRGYMPVAMNSSASFSQLQARGYVQAPVRGGTQVQMQMAGQRPVHYALSQGPHLIRGAMPGHVLQPAPSGAPPFDPNVHGVGRRIQQAPVYYSYPTGATAAAAYSRTTHATDASSTRTSQPMPSKPKGIAVKKKKAAKKTIMKKTTTATSSSTGIGTVAKRTKVTPAFHRLHVDVSTPIETDGVIMLLRAAIELEADYQRAAAATQQMAGPKMAKKTKAPMTGFDDEQSSASLKRTRVKVERQNHNHIIAALPPHSGRYEHAYVGHGMGGMLPPLPLFHSAQSPEMTNSDTTDSLGDLPNYPPMIGGRPRRRAAAYGRPGRKAGAARDMSISVDYESESSEEMGVKRRPRTRTRSGIVGASCHQCKNKKTWEHIVFCTRYKGDKDPSKITECGRLSRCGQRYCKECMTKYNDAEFIRNLYEEQKALREDVADGKLSFWKVWHGKYAGAWVCPFCRDNCCCANCRRKSGIFDDEE